MKCAKAFEELDKTIHDRITFDCGELELNEFIQKKASKHMKSGINKTLVLPASSPGPNGKFAICSFYTIAPSAIKRESLPQSLSKKLPHYPVPVFLIGQLAVHTDLHGKGLGKITLIKALEYLWEISFKMSAYAVVVDCLNKNAEQFYLKYGFEKLYENKGKSRLFIPLKTINALFDPTET